MAKPTLQALEDRCNTLLRMNLILAFMVLGIGYLWVSKEFVSRGAFETEEIVLRSRGGGGSAVLTAKELVFRDEANKPLARLSVDAGRPTMSFFSGETECVHLWSDGEEAEMVLRDASHPHRRASLAAGKESSTFYLTDPSGENTATLIAGPQGADLVTGSPKAGED